MDRPVMVKEEVEDAEAPSMAPSREYEEEDVEAPEAFRSFYQQDNCVTVAQLPPNYHHHTPPKPKPYHDITSSSSVKGKKHMEKNPELWKIKKGHSPYNAENAISEYKRMSLSYMQNKGFNYALSHSGEARSNALLRAEELKSNLGHAFPSFVKSLVRSHVASCFWMGLPAQFCKAHLPDKDTNIILEDECGKQFVNKYIAYKTGLSAGWRQFSARHNLLEGDVLVFQLVEPAKFKVHVVRANNSTEVDGALGHVNFDSQTKQNHADIDETAYGIPKRKRPKSLPLAIVPKKNKNMDLARSVAGPELQTEHDNDNEDFGSDVLEEIKLSVPSIQFEEVKSFEDFKILVDGMRIDTELSDDIRRKYYKLCCSQNAFLHEKLIGGVNRNLISGTISETVNIADAIRASRFTTSREEFIDWDKTLTAFEILGMNVGFLQTRLHRLYNIVFESEGSKDTKRYIEAKIKQAEADNEIRNVEARLETLKAASRRSSVDVASLKLKAEREEKLSKSKQSTRDYNRRSSQPPLQNPLSREKQTKPDNRRLRQSPFLLPNCVGKEKQTKPEQPMLSRRDDRRRHSQPRSPLPYPSAIVTKPSTELKRSDWHF